MYRKDLYKARRNALILPIIFIALGGCLEQEKSEAGFYDPNDPSDPGGNSAPVISGNPRTTVSLGEMYAFTPDSSDSDGDTLTFSIDNQPGWADFDAATGRLSGQPQLGDEGVYQSVRISVSDGSTSASLPDFSISVAQGDPGNAPPTISGTPPSQINANSAYGFTPVANDGDGDALTFSITGQPTWATFSTSTGRLSGTPSDGDIGVFSDIRISVSDGEASATLGPFSITVNAVSLGSVTLNWTPPTQNEDGSTLTDLAGYKIYWGTTPGTYPNSVTINGAGISSYVVDNLSPGTYEFVATSFNDGGVESVYSNPATRVLN